MCFRPTAAAKAKNCPACGALNPGMAKTCVKCKAPLEDAPAAEQKNEENK
ncbi:hypothetical protein LPY66_09265 [Dehalobacter sp. DCM]|nr:hypothetical protein LPY66_09265 [Dehalobacter sp. DCM]